MARLTHRLDDLGNPLDAFQGLPQGHRHFRLQEVDVSVTKYLVQLSHWHRTVARQTGQPRQLAQQVHDIAEGFLQEPNVAANVLCGRIDLVRDARCQLANGFKFLRLVMLLLNLQAFRDIVHDGHETDDLAAGIPDWRHCHLFMTNRAVPLAELKQAGPVLASPDSRPELVVRRPGAEAPERRLADDISAVETGLAPVLRVHVVDGPVGIHDHDGITRVLDGGGQ